MPRGRHRGRSPRSGPSRRRLSGGIRPPVAAPGGDALATARAAYGAGRLDEARSLCEAAIGRDPGNGDALQLLARIILRAGRAREAQALLQRALAVEEGVAGYHADLGDTCRALGAAAEAVRHYRAALRLDPNHLEALTGLGIAQVGLGQAREALTPLRGAAALAAGDPRAHSNLGNALMAAGEFDAAAASYRRALELDPGYVQAHGNLASLHIAQGRVDAAIGHARAALRRRPDYVNARFTLGYALSLAGEPAQAAAAFRAVLRRAPDHAAARFLLAAAGGAPVPPTAPAAYVRDIFDRQAALFDDHLVGHLDYCVPRALRAAYGRARPTATELAVLDLGCGTGLTGAAFRDLARRMVGVDLSPRMIAEAARAGHYDALQVAELAVPLAAADADYDLLLAGDVLIYVGALKELFRLARKALRRGGRFAFSVETAPGDGFTLTAAGRYAHSAAYLSRLAAAHGFEPVVEEAIAIRVEQGRGLPGAIHILAAG